LREQPVAHADPVERQQLGSTARQRHRQGEGTSPEAIAAEPEILHQFAELLILVALGGADPGLRQQTLLPAAVTIESLLRRRTQVALVIDRLHGARIALQHTQLGEQLAHRCRLARRQWQVMRAPGMGADGVVPGTRIAAGFALEFNDQEIGEARPGEFPAGGKSADTGADDQHRYLPGLAGRSEVPRTQPMTEVERNPEQIARRQGNGRAAAAGERSRTGCGNCGEEIASIHQRITCRHSCSK
jgi:hypothetical protein